MATNKISFAERSLDMIANPDKSRVIYRDTKTPQLYLYVTKNAKTFYYIKKFNGRTIQLKIAGYPNINIKEVRDIVRGYNADVAKGIDPTEKKQELKEELTLKKLFDLFVKDKEKTKRTINNDIWQFNKYLKKYHNSRLSSLTYTKIRLFHKSLSDTPYSANRCLALLSALFNYARKELRLNVENPCIGLKKYSEEAKQRILNEAELHRYKSTCDKWQLRPDKAMHSDIFLLFLYTGQRRNNVLSMKFQDVDFYSKTWTIPASEFKNKKPHTLPLMSDAVEILKRRHAELTGKSIYVFPSPVKKDCPIVEIKWQWKKFLEEAEITNFTRHDMRRTAGSIILMMTGNLKLVQKFLGHKSIATTAAVYSHIWDTTMSDAVEDAFKNISSNQNREMK